ncbi:hypothetical protein Bca52824_019322 [Brassica carinata]|uniref:Neprosin PEP catalytic domain-containing protein n=1 Tax=Brassica carinata TaxID=52824 RepID=A0A8X7VSQ7_BRACI|nr:hypothetical protein Bca52824_019322 [Brassica carinata]
MPDIEDTRWQVWHGNGTECPEGTIPVRRLNGTTGFQPWREVTIGHEYAIGFLNPPPPKIYGTKAVMNVWHPKVEEANEFSLGQVWLTAGTYDNNDLNSIEAGWQVYPKLYMDHQPRFFIFWTADAYTFSKCYNLRCAGFIQTSRKDPNLGPWWLGVRLSNESDVTPIGYWPLELFTRLTDHADNVNWGGEIVNLNVLGRHTSTQMGSGYLPGDDKAAYMRDLQISVSIGEFQAVSDLKVGATNTSYYNVEKYSNTSFAYGGPKYSNTSFAYGGPEHGEAAHLSLLLFF